MIKDGKRPWTSTEKKAITSYFMTHIRLSKAPKKSECDSCRAQYPVLSNRSWKNIKDCVRNLGTAHRRAHKV